MKQYSDQRERERERENLPTRSSVLKEQTDYEGASTEIQLNRIYYPRWLRYVISRIEEEGSVEKKGLILSAAKKAGCSKQTSTNYLEVETSEEGMFREFINEDGVKMITFREER